MAITKQSVRGMTEEQWRAARSGSIGGSDAATVLGLNPYSSPYALWAEKTGTVVPENISDKEAVRLGHFLEPYVAQRFAEVTGKKVRRENYILRNDLYPFAHANVDRLVIGERAGLECKTTSVLNLKQFKGGEYPANYYCQCMHYMAVTGYEKWYLAVLIGNQELRIFEILRDEDEIAALMEAEAAFWDCVTSRTPPAVDGMAATGKTLEAMYDGNGDGIDLTPVCSNLRQYLALKTQIKELEKQLEAVTNGIKEYMGNAVTGSYDGFSVNWTPRSSRRFDQGAFQRANPDVDLSPYYKTTTYRQFQVKG